MTTASCCNGGQVSMPCFRDTHDKTNPLYKQKKTAGSSENNQTCISASQQLRQVSTSHLLHVEVDSVQNRSLVNNQHRQLLEDRRQIFDAFYCRGKAARKKQNQKRAKTTKFFCSRTCRDTRTEGAGDRIRHTRKSPKNVAPSQLLHAKAGMA